MNPTKYQQFCINLLKKHGPMLGSELSAKLQRELQISSDYARKIIQRASHKGLFLSSKPISFGRRQFLYYLENQDISSVLPDILKTNRKGLSRVAQSLKHYQGIIVKDEAIKISAGVINKNTFPNHDTFEKVLNQLSQLDIVKHETDYHFVSLLYGTNNKSPNDFLFRFYRSHLINRLFTLEAIKWLEKMNMIGWDQSKVFDTKLNRVEYNGHLWDAVGYTYLYGHYIHEYVNNEIRKIPSFVFVESIFHREAYIEDLEGFNTRIEMQSGRIRNHPHRSRITPILLYRNMNKEAFDYAKSKGFMLINLHDFIGEYGTELFEFLVNPYKTKTIKQCGSYIDLLNKRGLIGNFLLKELYTIRHSFGFKQKGWKIQRHYHYEHRANNDKNIHYADWIMYNQNNVPFICKIILKEEMGHLSDYVKRLLAEVEAFKKSHPRFNSVEWILFDEEGIVDGSDYVNQMGE